MCFRLTFVIMRETHEPYHPTHTELPITSGTGFNIYFSLTCHRIRCRPLVSLAIHDSEHAAATSIRFPSVQRWTGTPRRALHGEPWLGDRVGEVRCTTLKRMGFIPSFFFIQVSATTCSSPLYLIHMEILKISRFCWRRFVVNFYSAGRTGGARRTATRTGPAVSAIIPKPGASLPKPGPPAATGAFPRWSQPWSSSIAFWTTA